MNYFYVASVQGQEVMLDEEESIHCSRVLRLRKGDEAFIVDGKGGLYNARVIEPDSRRSIMHITRSTFGYGKREHHLHIGIAPTKSSDRFEWFLEKSTEIGVDEITPIICYRSERDRIRTDRAQKVMIAAMKQSQRAFLPKLNQIMQFQDFVTGCSGGAKVITHCESKTLPLLSINNLSPTPVIILIGPEGDFGREEINYAVEHDFTEASLGFFTLRTETAGIVACQIFNHLYRQ